MTGSDGLLGGDDQTGSGPGFRVRSGLLEMFAITICLTFIVVLQITIASEVLADVGPETMDVLKGIFAFSGKLLGFLLLSIFGTAVERMVWIVGEENLPKYTTNVVWLLCAMLMVVEAAASDVSYVAAPEMVNVVWAATISLSAVFAIRALPSEYSQKIGQKLMKETKS